MIYTDVQTFCRINFRPIRRQFIYDRHRKYMRIPAGYDIETTRIETKAYMYHWQLGFGSDIVLGRTWEEFLFVIDQLNNYLIHYNALLIVWVANLGHEFSFLGRRYHWDKIFAKDSHAPLTAKMQQIEFRECLSISGQGGLKSLADKYCKTKKLVGDLDYTIIRNSKTPMTPEEIQYCINDVQILIEWGEYIFETYSDQKKRIPLTATSIIQQMVDDAAAATGHLDEIRNAVSQLYPPRETYNQIMQWLFRGGYTHANIYWCMIRVGGIIGADYTSSYPSVLLKDGYPKSSFVETDLENDGVHITDSRLRDMCAIIVIDFFGITRTTMHAIESEHKIIAYKEAVFDNGRLVKAEKIRVMLTELDYQIYEKFYTWEKIHIFRAHTAHKGHLPEYVLKPLRDAYRTKNRIKKQCKRDGIDPDTVPEYRNAKAAINSFYGLMVKRLNFVEWHFDEDTGEWYKTDGRKPYEKMIAGKVLSPYWGIWCTANARYKLLMTLYELEYSDGSGSPCNCVVYMDTDSLYFVDTPYTRSIIDKYNERETEINEALDPECRDIGLFDWIGTEKDGGPQHYTFETLGAKRYIKYCDDPDDPTGGHCSVTVAGMRKGSYEKTLCRTFATDHCFILWEDPKRKTGKIGYVDIDDLFDNFCDNLLLTCEESMKNASAYAKDEYRDTVVDQYGNEEIMHEYSGVAIVPITFKITLEEHYILLMEQIMDERRIPNWE